MVLTDVGTAQMTKEGQAPLTDSVLTGAVVPYVTEPHHWRQSVIGKFETESPQSLKTTHLICDLGTFSSLVGFPEI